MGLVKLGIVIFTSYTLGGRGGEWAVTKLGGYDSGPPVSDVLTAGRWTGRIVAFIGFSYIASRL